MGDHPGKNLKWLEQELLAEDTIHRDFSRLPNPEYQKDEDRLELVDILIGEDTAEPEPPVRNFANRYGSTAKSVRAEQAHIRQQFDPSAAVLTKTGKQLRSEKIAEKKANVNRNLKDLVFLAILECIGILAILGWWLQ
jgi:hypothetical protein